jgi:hypothetical protein
MAERPAPSWEAPEGTEHVAVEEGPDWRVQEGWRCKRGFGNHSHMCGKPSIVATLRGQRQPQWWAYCPEHAYGRWVENGKIMHWIVREKEAGDA